jgi:hypothetical protein
MNVGPCYIRNERLNFEMDGEQAYVELGGGSWAVLNRPARAIWESLAVPRTTDEVVEAALERFDGEEESVGRDVRSVLADWLERGLVHVHDGP